MSDMQERLDSGRWALYPSRLLLPVPAFTFQVPDGWVVGELPQSLAVVSPPEPIDGFSVNAIISSRRVSMKASLARAAVAAVARLQHDHPDLKIELEKVGRFGELATYLRAVSMTAGDPPRHVAQLHAMFFAPPIPGRTVTDLFTIVGTCPDEMSREIMPSFLEIIASFEFVPMPPEFIARLDPDS